MLSPDQHIVIIGNGIAGATLAINLRKQSNCKITLISAESATHFSRPALMYVYMGHMRYQDIVPYADWFWQEQSINLLHDKVEQIDFNKKQLVLQQRTPVRYDKLVLATGSGLAGTHWLDANIKGVQGFVTLQDLELMQQQTQHINQAVIVGGGLIGIEMAEMLRSKNIAVTMLVRDRLFWRSNLPEQEAALVTKHILEHEIKLKFEDELAEIIADKNGQVRSIKTVAGQEIPCEFVGIATGVKPAVDFLRNSDLAVDRGILVNDFFETSLPGVYAIGDCAQFTNPKPGIPALEQLWYTGRAHAETLAFTLAGTRTKYERGPWFNSAKFLDIEYQTYGFMPNNWPDAYDSLYWQHPTQPKAIRLFYEKETALLKGINLLGIRYRHDLCQHWFMQNYTLHQVMPELKAANFDPEFYKKYEPELLSLYFSQFPDQKEKTEKYNWWQLSKKLKWAATT